MKNGLTPTQVAALQLAARRPDGNLDPLPQNIRGAARESVIQGLLSRALITKCYYPEHVAYHLTSAGLAVGGTTATNNDDW